MLGLSTPFVIGIAGGSGSGKTTLAQTILREVGVDRIAFLPHDAYYRRQDQMSMPDRLAVNYDHPNALETELLIEHIKQLKTWNSVAKPVYDFKAYTRSHETVRVEPRTIIMVEGILIFAEPKLRKLIDMKLFVDTDPDLCFIRRLERDINERGRTVESVVSQYLGTVRPSYIEFVEPSKRFADVIIPDGGLNSVASEMVVDHLRKLIGHVA
ncbi:MAG TPA: uridine kinase [Anaerolineaceae bacterium]|nr:uridine kinase [Anaerolineaceae bacterium]